jgi:hypothetical protein
MEEFRGKDREFIRFIFSDNRGKMDEEGSRVLHELPVATGGDDRQDERMAV